MNSISTSVSLTSSGANTLLRYDISSSDLETASFPVTIDPRVAFTGQNSAIVTSCIHNRKKDEPGHTATYLTTGCGGTSPSIYTYITLCQFNELVEKKASDTILSAQLYMRVSGYASSYKFVCAYPMLKPWNVTTATWNSIQADTNTYISDRIQSFVTRTDTTHCVFDITDLYKTWYEKDEAGNSKNYGVALARPREYSGYDYTVFNSSNASDSSKKPYVVVDYVSHAGVKTGGRMKICPAAEPAARTSTLSTATSLPTTPIPPPSAAACRSLFSMCTIPASPCRTISAAASAGAPIFIRPSAPKKSPPLTIISGRTARARIIISQRRPPSPIPTAKACSSR